MTALTTTSQPSPPARTAPGGAAPATTASLSRTEKAAIVLVALGPEAAAALLTEVGDERIARFARTVAAMKETPPAVVERVLGEFLEKLTDDRTVEGGRAAVRRFLEKALDEEGVDRAMAALSPQRASVWEALAEVEDSRLAKWLTTEHRQVAAVAMARLPAAKAARVAEALDADDAREIVLRMGAAAAIAPATAERIGETIRRDVLPGATSRRGKPGAAELIGAVMNHVSTAARERLLTAMTAAAPDLAGDVKRIMFTFEHIASRVAPRDVSLILREIDEPTLLIALKAGDEATRTFVLGNISKRLAERMEQDIADAEDPSPADGEAAQAALVAAIVSLRDAGTIVLADGVVD